MDQAFHCTIQGTVVGSTELGHAGRTGMAYARFRIIHPTGYRKNGQWVPTAPMEFQVTCWTEQQILLARRLKAGNEVLVDVKKITALTQDRTDEPVTNLTPAGFTILDAPKPAPAARGQRSGDLVQTPYGETIAADAWPDVVTDLELVHHG
ncbi:hypothetical protein [Actinoplanes sp. NPDC051859]|uniref:hypothetical protein n=1 Tax=Actinoplanes sp. NPDC051859 TaxID=3363909 RepID=UPI00379C0A2A